MGEGEGEGVGVSNFVISEFVGDEDEVLGHERHIDSPRRKSAGGLFPGRFDRGR